MWNKCRKTLIKVTVLGQRPTERLRFNHLAIESFHFPILYHQTKRAFSWKICKAESLWREVLAAPAAAAAKSLQSRPTLCDPIAGSPPGSPIPEILQARTWVDCHFLLQCVKLKSLSCVRLSNPMDCSSPGSSIHGIFQARVLEMTNLDSILKSRDITLSTKII